MSAGNDIANEAKKLLGKPFKYGASGPDAFDSSSLVVYVFKKLLVLNYHVGKKIAKNGGDLVFPHAGHVGISIGGNEYIFMHQTLEIWLKFQHLQHFWLQEESFKLMK